MSKVSNKPASPVDPASVDLNNVGAWELAHKQAKDAGILWQRPADDKRSAHEIINDAPLLRDLGNQSGVRDALEQRVGADIEMDADGAFRAAQVLEHIEKFDRRGNRIVGGNVEDGRVNGFTKGGDARNGTEAGRLQDFGKFGFANLAGELRDVSTAAGDIEARKLAQDLGLEWERPLGDERSAQDIIDATPLLKNLGNQSQVKDMLKERVGDLENDADAAFRAIQVLEHIEKFDGGGSRLVGGNVDNGRVDGFTKDADARNGTEAGRLQDFGKFGFSNLNGKLQEISTAANDLEARKQAGDLGIAWERKQGNDRSAQDIMGNSPLLKNLGNQSQIKDMLKERVGDFEKDADASYRADQVLAHVERLDRDGSNEKEKSAHPDFDNPAFGALWRKTSCGSDSRSAGIFLRQLHALVRHKSLRLMPAFAIFSIEYRWSSVFTTLDRCEVSRPWVRNYREDRIKFLDHPLKSCRKLCPLSFI